jgi:hypothetical protein
MLFSLFKGIVISKANPLPGVVFIPVVPLNMLGRPFIFFRPMPVVFLFSSMPIPSSEMIILKKSPDVFSEIFTSLALAYLTILVHCSCILDGSILLAIDQHAFDAS